MKVRRGIAAHPEDRDANIVILEFYNNEEMADESHRLAGQARGTPKGRELRGF